MSFAAHNVAEELAAEVDRPDADAAPSGERLQNIQQPTHWYRPNPLVHPIAVSTGMNDIDTFEPQRVESRKHRTGQPRRIGALELEPQAVATAGDKEVELGSGVSGPEPDFPGSEPKPADDRLEGQALEARAHFRMGPEIARLLDSRQGVQQPAVGDVDLW